MSEPITGSLICFSHEFAGAYLLEYSRKADRTIALPLTWISLDSENPAQRWVSCGIHQRNSSSGSYAAFGLYPFLTVPIVHVENESFCTKLAKPLFVVAFHDRKTLHRIFDLRFAEPV